MRKIFAGLTIALMVATACGGGDDDSTNAATLEDVAVSECVKAPVTVGSISILGQHRIEGISDLEVCLDANVRAGLVPQLIEQPDCGNPCFTIEVRNFDVASDSRIEIKMKRDGKDVAPISFDPPALNPTSGQGGRVCVVGYGDGRDPCAEYLTTPKNLTTHATKKQVALRWSPSKDTGDDDVIGYEIYRSTTGEDPVTFVLHTTATEAAAVDTDVTRKTQYWYYVVAIDADGNRSTASNVAKATTP